MREKKGAGEDKSNEWVHGAYIFSSAAAGARINKEYPATSNESSMNLRGVDCG